MGAVTKGGEHEYFAPKRHHKQRHANGRAVAANRCAECESVFTLEFVNLRIAGRP